MIVTCQECSTSFQLDDARIPASGARVRCSRCKHAFFLPNPSTSGSQAVHAVAEEAIRGKAGRVPEAARDLEPESGRAEPDEEDWQFSQEIRVADDEPDDADPERAAHPHPDSFDLTGDFGRGFDPDSLSSEEPAPPNSSPTAPSARAIRKKEAAAASASPVAAAAKAPAKTIPAEPKRDESSFGSIDDFSSLIEDDDVSIELAADPASEPRRAVKHAEKPRVAPASSATSEDLGDPESWDLVGSDADQRVKSNGVASLVRPSAAPRKKAGKASLDLFADADLPSAHEDPEESSVVYRRMAAAGRLVGWCATLASVVFVGGMLLRPEWARWADVPQRLEVGSLVIETTRSGWLETSRAGFLLVVEGEVRNTGSQPSPPVPVQLALLDRSGARLAEQALPAGQRLTERALRESRPEELSVALGQAISGWRATQIAPGEVRRFTVVSRAEELPERARRLLLEVGAAASP